MTVELGSSIAATQSHPIENRNNTRNTSRKNEPLFYVSKLRGREGVLTFIISQDGGEWGSRTF